MYIILAHSHRKDKKFQVGINNKQLHFGDSRYEDYTIHKDNIRKERYIKRHKKNENWNKDGIDTAGWWSRWLLWNKPTIEESIEDIKNRFNITILFHKEKWIDLPNQIY